MADQQLVKMRVLNRYIGEEGARNEGDKVFVTPERARQLIANGNAAPIVRNVGPTETKPVGPLEKKQPGGTDGPAEPASSLPAVQVSPAPIATKRPVGRPRKVGALLQ